MTNSTPTESSRRQFIKTSAVAAAGAGVLGSLPMAARAYARSDETIRIGLIGCGGRGTGATTQALSTRGDVKLVAMADAFSDRLESHLKQLQSHFRNRPGRVDVDPDHRFVGFDAYKKLLASDIDMVIIATPPGFRPIHFEAAVKANKNIFAEKPVATDPPGIRKFLAAVKLSKQKNLKVGVGLQRHHQYTYIEALKRIRGGEIGDVVDLRVYWNGGGVWEPRRTREQCKSEMEYQMRNWYYYTWLCGDHIVEQHIHNLDVGNWIKNAHPVMAYGMGGRQVRTDKRYGEIFDHHAVEFVYADGTRMFSQCRHIHNCWNSVTEHAAGTKGTVDLTSNNRIGASITTAGKKWSYKAKTNKTNNPYQTEHDELFAAIREDRPYNEGEYGATSTMTAIMGRLATYGGKAVDWNEAINSKISLLPDRFAWDANPKSMPNDKGEYKIPTPGVTRVI